MDKKLIFNLLLKNRFLIVSCIMLVFGTVSGTSMLGFLPEEIIKNLFGFISNQSDNYINEFINRLTFPLLILIGLYFSGTGIFGGFTAPLLIFIFGAIFGFENSIKFAFLGTDYIVNCMLSFFTSTLFYGFAVLLMSENAFFYSKDIYDCVKGKNGEKTHYNARKHAVKFIAFTACFAVISAFSTFISLFIRSRI